MRKFIFTLFLIGYLPSLFAICPLCTIAVGTGIGLSQGLGVDDTITGIWIGGFLLSLGFWTCSWMERRNIRFRGRNISILALYYLSLLYPLWLYGFVGRPANQLWGIDKLLLGIILGSIGFILGNILKNIIKKKPGYPHFCLEKVVIILTPLVLLTLSFLVITQATSPFTLSIITWGSLLLISGILWLGLGRKTSPLLAKTDSSIEKSSSALEKSELFKTVQEFVEKVDASKKMEVMDLSSDQDLTIAIMNLISIEEHFFFTGAKTGKTSYYDLIDQVRNIRKALLKKIITEYEGEVWCISKHLLAASMRLTECGTKQLSLGKKEVAYDFFQKAYELYCLFWGVNMRIIDMNAVKKISDNAILQKDTDPKSLYDKLNVVVRTIINCCLE